MQRLLMVLAVLGLLVGACRYLPTPSSCTDGVRNGTESDVDCGGPSCGPCALTKACLARTDCSSGVCAQKVCAPASCRDGQRGGDESDVDCGGASCAPCATGQSCAAAPDCEDAICAGGTCAAPSCTDQVLNGDETDLDCGGGACPACPPGAGCERSRDCVVGACVDAVCSAPGGCFAPLLQCGPMCVDPLNNPAHCGGCGQPCPMGRWCVNGTCQITCAPGTQACGPRCVNTQNDVFNCGACSTMCAPGERCVAGACQVACPPGQVVCNGACVNTATDNANCFQCGVPCAPGEVCSGGFCTAGCSQPLESCDGGAFCVDSRVDPDHCGGCGQACPAVQNAVRVCEFGNCSRSLCFPGFADCNGLLGDGCEANLGTDGMNCGFCGNACQVNCMNGMCP